MSATRYERETIITLNEEEDFATVYTSSLPWKRRLEKMAAEYDEVKRQWDRSTDTEYSCCYTMPKKLVAIRKPSRRPPMSEDRKKELSERMRFLREKQR